MATNENTKAPLKSRLGETSPENPPSGGSGVRKPDAQDEAMRLAGIEAAIADIRQRIEKVVDRASKANDINDLRDIQREDRAYLLGALNSIGDGDQPPCETAHPIEGMFRSQDEFSKHYAGKMRDRGLFLLPTVATVIPPDQAGNTTVIVEYAVADVEGRYWPAAVRTSGTGNDRSQRGGSGDKGMPRALSAAWKEALCRVFFLSNGYDPEFEDRAHDQPSVTRPSHQGDTAGVRKKFLSVREEDEFRDRVLDGIERATSVAAIERLQANPDFKQKFVSCSGRTQGRINDMASDKKRRLAHRQSDQRQGESREQDRQESDLGEDDYGQGGNPYAESRDLEMRNDEEADDIPF